MKIVRVHVHFHFSPCTKLWILVFGAPAGFSRPHLFRTTPGVTPSTERGHAPNSHGGRRGQVQVVGVQTPVTDVLPNRRMVYFLEHPSKMDDD